MAVIMRVNDLEAYWKRLSENLSQTLFAALGDKSEAGFDVSEYGIQLLLLRKAEALAEGRRMNVPMVSALCLCVARYFPPDGRAEIRAVKAFLPRSGWNIPLEDFDAECIARGVYKQGGVVTPELYDLLRKYYSGDESVPEVGLVRYLQRYLDENRALLHGGAEDAGRAAEQILLRAAETYESGRPSLPEPDSISDELLEATAETLRELYAFDGADGVYAYLWS